MNDAKVETSSEVWGEILSSELSRLDQHFVQASEEDRLQIYQLSVACVLMRLKACPGFTGGTQVLEDLMLRLSDVVSGTPALQPVKRSGRAKQGWRDAILQGRAAAAVDFLVEHGETERDATRVVAKALEKAGAKGRRGGGVSEATVRDWRSRSDKLGDKQDARYIRERVTWLRQSIPEKGISKQRLRQLVSAFVAAGRIIPDSD